MAPTPDAELVRATLAGDRKAFGELVRRYQTGACAARAVVRDRHAAEDAAQEAFLTAYAKLGELRDPTAFGGWLLRIARQKSLPIGEKVRATVPVPDTAADSPEPDDHGHTLLAAVMALPEAEVQVVVLHYFDEHPVPAVAAILGRPVGTVTKQLSRAYARLRTTLTGTDP